MSVIALQDEKEIFECYKSGMLPRTIKRIYKITHLQFAGVIKRETEKQENQKIICYTTNLFSKTE